MNSGTVPLLGATDSFHVLSSLSFASHSTLYSLDLPFSTFLPWRNPWNNFQFSGNPCIKIIIKVDSWFNVNKCCKPILISAIYNMKIYWQCCIARILKTVRWSKAIRSKISPKKQCYFWSWNKEHNLLLQCETCACFFFAAQKDLILRRTRSSSPEMRRFLSLPLMLVKKSLLTHEISRKLQQYVYCFPVNGRILFFHGNPELVQG
jgi:hypothetical protein